MGRRGLTQKILETDKVMEGAAIIENMNAHWGSNWWTPGKDTSEEDAVRGARERGIRFLVRGPMGGWYGRKPTIQSMTSDDLVYQPGSKTYIL